MHRDVSASTLEMVPLPPAARPQTPASQSSESLSSSATPQSIGVNLRVTGHCSQGGRKYMEDFFSVAYHQSENAKDLEYAFVGIYDGHGGSEAAIFAKEHLMMEIINQKLFWSDCDEDILKAIREGYIATHYAMWRDQEKWPKTATGLPSTAGTTATVAFIRHEKIYIGHVGDSGIVLGYQNSNENFWRSKPLTQDHKPECSVEKARIMNSGGKVVVKSGVPRVVWNRPRTGHKGPVRRSTPIDEIPFLAVARSLGDLWSYNSALNEFVVSPDPDVNVIKIDPTTFRCLIFGTDGLWNVVSPGDAVDMVYEKETVNEHLNKFRGETNNWCNPSKGLVEKALKTWSSKKMRADNTSVVTVILNPPGGKPTHPNSFNEFTSSYGLEYVRTSAEILANQNNVQMASLQNNHQKLLPSYLYEAPQPMYGNSLHHSPHYETIGSSAMRNLQQQLHQQDGYVPSNIDSDDNSYTANYETNCGTNGYQYYEDQGSNTFTNSFAESYNSLLASEVEREDSSRSNGSNFISSNSDNSNESINSNPSDYHSYHSLNHTGLAGHDRVQHHFPNNEHKIEQLLYQEQCMSAAEGYSLTKLETRGEQQLRSSSFNENSLNSLQTFQIFGSERNHSSNTEFNQSNSMSGSYQNRCYSCDSSNSNFLSSYEDDARCYEPNGDCVLLEELPVTSGTTTSLCIERLDSLNANNLKKEISEQTSSQKSELEDKMDIVEANKQNPSENIQIHEISSSIVEEGLLPESFSLPNLPLPIKEENQIKTKEKSQLQNYENRCDATHRKKPTLPKLVHYPNVPNENFRNMPRTSLQQYPRFFEKRMLRSMTMDYSKRTLRSRNSLSKDMKAKSTANPNARRSTIVQSKFIKAVQSPVRLETSPVITKNSLNLRSRQILTTAAIWGAADSQVSSIPSSSSSPSSTLSSHIQQRKSKSRAFCVTPCSSNLNKPRTNRSFVDSSATKVREKFKSGTSQFNHNIQQQKIAISFAKRMNLRNSGWGTPKTTIQTRNRVQKRLSR